VIPTTLIETVAATAHAAIREMGIAAGEVDCPTWQILPGDRKIQYRRAAQSALAEQAPMAGDPLMERMATMAYARWAQEQQTKQPNWEGLGLATQTHWRMVVAVARVLTYGSKLPAVAPAPPAKQTGEQRAS
jgi:hypothetical protein